MLPLSVLVLAIIAAVVAETTVNPADDNITTTEPPILEFALDVIHRESTVSSIQFDWEAAVPVWMKVLSYTITVKTLDSEAGSVMTYPALNGDDNYFEAEDLIINTQFDVCLEAKVLNGTDNATQEEMYEKVCMESFTIPIIRWDSIFMTIACIMVFILLVIAGICSHKCAVSKHAREAAEREAEEDEAASLKGSKND